MLPRVERAARVQQHPPQLIPQVVKGRSEGERRVILVDRLRQRPGLVVGDRPVSRGARPRDRKSTRLNSSHLGISYAVFCLKKKKLSAVKIRMTFEYAA